MTQINGQVVLPDAEGPLAGVWHIRVLSDVSAAIGPGTKIRAGELRVPDNGTGATAELPPGFYRARFVSNARSGAGQVSLPPVGEGWYEFELTEVNTTWSQIIQAPVLVPVTPADVTLASQARQGAEAAALDAQQSRDAVLAVPATTAGLMKVVDADANSDFRKQQDLRLSAALAAGRKAVEIAVAQSLPSPRPGVTREQARRAYADTLQALYTGTLQTRKADYTGKIQMAAAASSSQFLPEYRDLAAGTADHTTIAADKGYFVAVTAVYNLTIDPGRTVNRYNSFDRNIQRVNLTVTPAAADVLEVVGTIHAYQGVWPTAGVAGNVTFEVVEWDGRCMLTTAGTGGGVPSVDPITPLVPKLPLPTASAVRNDGFRYNQMLLSPNGAAGTATNEADAQQPWLNESVSPRAHFLNAAGTYDRLRRGVRFRMRTTAAERGVDGTTPMFKMPLGVFNPAVGQVSYGGVHTLVRVADQYADPSGLFPLGRLFLLHAGFRIPSGGFPTAGTETGGNFAADLFRLPGDPDLFDAMKVILP